jgi:dihydroorotate dehydrogenase (fumarate)
LFEEQIAIAPELEGSLIGHHESPTVLHYLRPELGQFALGPDEYLEQIRLIKDAVDIPVIASLNGVTAGKWLECARQLDQAGADALELNVYRMAASPHDSAERVEDLTLEMLARVKDTVKIPVAVKLSPFYTSLSHFVARLSHAGADGIVLFNQFYQPDIDLENLEAVHQLTLTTSSDLLLRLHWLAILSAQTTRSLAVSGGVHSAPDALKALVAGAHGVQLTSEILKRGTRRFGEMLHLMTRWLEAHEYASLAQVRGKMTLSHCADPAAYERTEYLHILNACSRAVG